MIIKAMTLLMDKAPPDLSPALHNIMQRMLTRNKTGMGRITIHMAAQISMIEGKRMMTICGEWTVSSMPCSAISLGLKHNDGVQGVFKSGWFELGLIEIFPGGALCLWKHSVRWSLPCFAWIIVPIWGCYSAICLCQRTKACLYVQ